MSAKILLGALFFIGANCGLALVLLGQDTPTKALGLAFEFFNLGMFAHLMIKGDI
jgi:hypothetical protein